jgi:exosortase family protein XrtF
MQKKLIVFASKFVGLYLFLNLLYLLWINFLGNQIDGISELVAMVSQKILILIGYDVSLLYSDLHPRILFYLNNVNYITVSEGCNGVSVMITFFASILSFKGTAKSKVLFLSIGLFGVFLLNILRVSTLFYVALNHHEWFSFFHEYAFTALIYTLVFLLFIFWVNTYGGSNFNEDAVQ